MTKHYFTFTFEAPERDDNGPYPSSKDVTMRVSYDDDTAWTSPLLDFAEFLSTIYGYDVREKIRFLDKYGVSDFRSEQYTLTDLE